MRILFWLACALALPAHAQTSYPSKPVQLIVGFAPVSLVATLPNLLVIHPSLPVKDFPQFVRFAKSRPSPDLVHVVVCGDPGRNRLMVLEGGHTRPTTRAIVA